MSGFHEEFLTVQNPDEAVDLGRSEEPEELDRVVVVIGSFDWDDEVVIQAALIRHHSHKPVRLVTAGCPQGAEEIARKWALMWGVQYGTVRDEDIPSLDGAFAVAFIKDHSEGAERALEAIRQARMWVEIHRVDTERNVSPWASR